jgi:hypothetical protein
LPDDMNLVKAIWQCTTCNTTIFTKSEKLIVSNVHITSIVNNNEYQVQLNYELEKTTILQLVWQPVYKYNNILEFYNIINFSPSNINEKLLTYLTFL